MLQEEAWSLVGQQNTNDQSIVQDQKDLVKNNIVKENAKAGHTKVKNFL